MKAKFKKLTSLVTGLKKSIWLPSFALCHILSLPAFKTRLEGVSEFYHRECPATEGWAALLCDGWLARKESKPNASRAACVIQLTVKTVGWYNNKS